MSFKIEHRVGVPAPPEVLWDLVSDLSGWAAWTPLYPAAAGRLAIGAKLDVTLALPGGKPEPIAPVVVDWVPHMQLVWRLKLLGGLLRTVRYMEIEPLDNGRASVFSHGEMFEGPAAMFMPKALRRQIKVGFIAMSEALQGEALRRAGAAASS